MKCIIFFRGGYFYPTEYPENYSDWQAEADRNPGTTKIMDGLTGKLLWLPSVAGRAALAEKDKANER